MCAVAPIFPHSLPSRLKCNVGRIMENYPVYKKRLKSGGAPTESNYPMFQHPFHRKGSVSRATHHAYETHLVHVTISWYSTVDPGCHCLVYSLSACDGRVFVSTRDEKNRKKNLAWKHVFVFISLALSEEWWPATTVTLHEWKMRLNKGSRDSLPCHFGVPSGNCEFSR